MNQFEFYVYFDPQNVSHFQCGKWDWDMTVNDLLDIVSEDFGIPRGELEVYNDKLKIERENLTGEELINHLVAQQKVITISTGKCKPM
jgi:hypothetical protein